MPENTGDPRRHLYALDLLEAGELFEVAAYDHPDFGLYVVFDDEISHEYDDAIDRLVDQVAALPAVARAHREDREVMLVGGSMDGTALGAWLTAWWRAELLEQPPPEQASGSSPSASRSLWPWSKRRRDA